MSAPDINIFTFNGLSPLTTRGDVLYRDASGNARLAAGTSGQFLKTLGAAADPAWGDVPGFILQMASGGASGTSPLDATTYYVGNLAGFAAGTADGPPGCWLGAAATLRAVYGRITVAGTLGSNNAGTSASTMILRRDASTDIVTITSTLQCDSAANDFSATGLSVAVSAGALIYLKWVAGTWVTNPTICIVNAIAYFTLP